jgi:MSHA biogenesis protein MshK
MDQSVTSLVRSALAMLLAGLSCAAHAAEPALPDPTRPAPGQMQSDAQPIDNRGPQLQSILISPRRKMAVINGQPLHVGEKFGDAVLQKISEHEVVLKNGSELQVLKLFPDVEKQKSRSDSRGKAVRGKAVRGKTDAADSAGNTSTTGTSGPTSSPSVKDR